MKVILYMAMTVNGYIAKENDDTPWSDEEWKSYEKIVKKFKNLIIGRKTYEIMKEDANLFNKLGNPFTVIVTRQKLKIGKNFVLVKSPKAAINLLKEKGFSEALLGGGGTVNGAFMKEGLVDEMVLDVEPTIFGKGIKLFADSDFEANLELIGTKKLSKNEVQLHYKVLK